MVTIEEFLKLFPTYNTVKSYRRALNLFSEVVEPPLNEEYFNSGRKYENDVVAYLNHLEKKGYTSKTFQCRMGALRSFLVENGVELPRRFWKRLKINGEPMTRDRLFSKQELRMIFSHLDIVSTTFHSSQLSNGLRIDDTLQIKLKNLHLEKNPPRFYYHNQKIRRYCVAFLTSEAKTYIEEWLKVRESWCMENIWMHGVYRGQIAMGFEEWWEQNDRNLRLFPFGKSVIYTRWYEALDCTGLNQRDPSTNRRLLHNQTFRKYFRTHIGTMLSESVVEALTGHSGGLNSVRNIYNRYGSDCEEQLAQDFLKVEHLLSLGVGDVHVETEMEKMKKLLEDQQRIIDDLVKKDLEKNYSEFKEYQFPRHKETGKEMPFSTFRKKQTS